MPVPATPAGAMPPMPPCGLMYYGNVEYQRCLFVYAAGGFEAARESSVEAPLSVGVAYMDGHRAFRRRTSS